MRTSVWAIGLLVVLSGTAAAQSARAKVDMNAPAPRLPNGKPSMEGLWSQTRRADVTNPKVQPGHVPELPYTAWGKRQWDNYDVVKNGDYAGSCMPFGWSRTLFGSGDSRRSA